MKPVYCHIAEKHEGFEKAINRNTMLTACFEMNKVVPGANCYMYVDFEIVLCGKQRCSPSGRGHCFMNVFC